MILGLPYVAIRYLVIIGREIVYTNYENVLYLFLNREGGSFQYLRDCFWGSLDGKKRLPRM